MPERGTYESHSQKEAQQGARANDHSRHVACYSMKYETKSPIPERNVSTRRAGCDRGSSLTLGKKMTTRTKLNVASLTSSVMMLLNVFSHPLGIPEGAQWALRIGWQVKRQSGSHRILARVNWPDFVFAFHDGEEMVLGCYRV